MMSLTRVTLYGFYQYDENLFENVILPEELDKDILINCIMSKSGELYPYQQSLPNLKRNIELWFKRNQSNFKRQIQALQSEFNPIENYDRYEEFKKTNSQDYYGSNTTDSSTNGSSEGKVSAYNENDYTNSTFGSSKGSASSTTSYNSGNKTSESNINHIHGNIGVTTASTMIREVVELYSFDLYENIAQRFEKEFLVQVY